MDGGRRQVNEELNQRVAQQIGQGPGGDPKLFRFRLGSTHIHIAASDDLQAKGQAIF
jgi:hypothetical protein